MSAVFGAKSVHRASAAALKGVRIPKRSREFLQNVGVPDVSYWELVCGGIEQSIPTLAEHGRAKGDDHWAHFEIDRYRMLGYSEISDFWCLDQASRGALVTVSLPSFAWNEQTIITTFVNSNVQKFGECIYVFETGCRSLRKRVKKRLGFETMARQLRKIDRAAFSGENHWWSFVVEENRITIED